MRSTLSHATLPRMKKFLGLIFLVGLLWQLTVHYPDQMIGWIGRGLVVDQTPQPSDAIVVLLGGETPDRVMKAHKLYLNKVAPRIVFGSGMFYPNVMDDAPPGTRWMTAGERYLKALRSWGTPKEALVMLPSEDAYDTAHELQVVVNYARKENFHRVTLVSSNTHTRRVSLIWQRIAPEIPADTVATPAPGYDRWWENGEYVRAVGYEVGALVKEFVRRF